MRYSKKELSRLRQVFKEEGATADNAKNLIFMSRQKAIALTKEKRKLKAYIEMLKVIHRELKASPGKLRSCDKAQ